MNKAFVTQTNIEFKDNALSSTTAKNLSPLVLNKTGSFPGIVEFPYELRASAFNALVAVVDKTQPLGSDRRAKFIYSLCFKPASGSEHGPIAFLVDVTKY